jgi:hypothetical protein
VEQQKEDNRPQKEQQTGENIPYHRKISRKKRIYGGAAERR